MLLTELFQSDVQINVEKEGSNTAVYSFSSGKKKGWGGLRNKTYKVGFVKEKDDDDVWELLFYLSGMFKKSTDVTGTGDAFIVFSGVNKCLEIFYRKYQPEYIIFGAKEPSRRKLYDTFVARLKKNGWKTSADFQNNYKYYMITK